MVTARLRLNTYRVAAVRLAEVALGSGWWPLAMRDEVGERGKALVLWVNSTPGLLAILAMRVDTEGAWTQYKKPSLEEMMVLDPRVLDDERLDALAAMYDEVANQEFTPFPSMSDDPVRARIDGAMWQPLASHRWPHFERYSAKSQLFRPCRSPDLLGGKGPGGEPNASAFPQPGPRSRLVGQRRLA
jgi:hypothetical protein